MHHSFVPYDVDEVKEAYHIVGLLLFGIVMAAIMNIYFLKVTLVSGESMMPTLQDEDRVLTNVFIYRLTEVKRHDIIIFQATEEEAYIKRVIGLPGDRIAYRQDDLWVNG